MAKGGARAHSGPAPDPNALRRDRDAGDWTTLPASGREGPLPEWPLTKATQREIALWAREWKRPQAVMWERNGQEVEVALYVRSLRMAEMPKAPTNARTLVKQQQEALGLSLPGLARNRWRIEDVSSVKPAPAAVGRSARDRFRVVTGGLGD
jgi:hypothetical protein